MACNFLLPNVQTFVQLCHLGAFVGAKAYVRMKAHVYANVNVFWLPNVNFSLSIFEKEF